MTFLILTPELERYFKVIFLLLICGNYTASYVLHKSCAYLSSRSIIQTANYLHGFLLVFGVIFLPLWPYLNTSLVSLSWMVPVGIAIGHLFFRMEIYLYRLFFRTLSLKRGNQKKNKAVEGIVQIDNRVECLTSQPLNVSKPPVKVEISIYDRFDFSMRDLIIAALVEEMLYRGLFQPFLMGLFPAVSGIFAFIFANFVFGLMHYNHGFHQLINKWVMGIILGISLVVTGSLYIAFVAHIFFNILAYQEIKRRAAVWLAPF